MNMSMLVGICLAFSAGMSFVVWTAIALPKSPHRTFVEDLEQMEAIRRG